MGALAEFYSYISSNIAFILVSGMAEQTGGEAASRAAQPDPRAATAWPAW